MLHYNTLFGLQLSKKILKMTDNLSRTLQKQTMSAAEGQAVAELTVCTLKAMRTEASFDLFFDLVDVSKSWPVLTLQCSQEESSSAVRS